MTLERVDVENCEDRLQVALHRARYDFVLGRLRPGERLLEVGVGSGTFTRELLPQCDSYKGVEYDPAACLTARQKSGGKAEIVEGDARCLPFGENEFSFIVCLEVLEHLGDFRAGVRSLHKCLRPDGVAVISVPYRRVGGPSKINEHHPYEPGEQELVSLLRELFARVEVYYQYFEETWTMRIARRLHLLRVLGLVHHYADLVAGLPQATSRLRLGPKAKGMKMGLTVVIHGKKQALAPQPSPVGPGGERLVESSRLTE